jgi:heat shock protein HtpX
MAYTGLQGFKASNERKTVFLLLMFPVLLFLCFWVAMAVSTLGQESLNMASWAERFDVGMQMTKFFFPIVLVVVVIWGLIVFFFQKQLMFKFAGARELTRKENSELYNVVENLCISRGLPMPKI